MQAVDCGPFDAQVRVAPRAEAESLQVAFGDVHAPDEARASVDDGHLAVVAVVHLAGEQREPHFQESPHLDAFAAHAVVEAVWHVPTSHVVIEQAHFDALPGFVHEQVAHEPPDGVVLEDVKLEMDVVSCT